MQPREYNAASGMCNTIRNGERKFTQSWHIKIAIKTYHNIVLQQRQPIQPNDMQQKININIKIW